MWGYFGWFLFIVLFFASFKAFVVNSLGKRTVPEHASNLPLPLRQYQNRKKNQLMKKGWHLTKVTIPLSINIAPMLTSPDTFKVLALWVGVKVKDSFRYDSAEFIVGVCITWGHKIRGWLICFVISLFFCFSFPHVSSHSQSQQILLSYHCLTLWLIDQL